MKPWNPFTELGGLGVKQVDVSLFIQRGRMEVPGYTPLILY